MTLYGRSKPYNNTKHCNRCGIERRRVSGGLKGDYCPDCTPYKKQMESSS